jgi:hypothetical protein
MKKFSKRYGFCIAVYIFAVIAASPSAFAEGVGKLTYVEGRVDVAKDGSEMALPIKQGESVSVGDALRTKSGSKAEIEFNDGSVVRLAQNSRVELKDYQLDKNNKRITATIKLDRGKARTIVAKMGKSADFNILTPNAEGTIKGSDVFTFYQAGSSGMLVAEGKMELKNLAHPESTVLVSAGNSALVNLEQLPANPRPYMDLERKMHEQDTYIPPATQNKETGGVMKGVFVALSGNVKITGKDSSSSRIATLNDIIGEGDRIDTGDNGSVEIKFENGCGLNLKPDTHITITKLVIDPKNGEYQNLFNASSGKIKARIENLKGKSTFEIKTPTAICGARATIMYVNVSPMMTKIFFEGGNGYILNTINGINQTVGMAQSAYAGAGGESGDPTNPSGDDRSGFTEGWGQGNGTEGYSSPDAGSSYVLGQDFANNNNNALNAGLDTGLTGGSVYVPFENTIIAGETETLPETTSFDMTFDGEFGAIDKRSKHWYQPKKPYFSPDSGAPISASITADRLMGLAWSGILSATVSGTAVNGEGLNFCRGIVQGTTNEGGAIYGWAGGTGFGESDWKGVASSLYVDPTGRAGVIFGHMAGDGEEAGVFSGIGDLFIKLQKTLDLTGTTPEDLIASRETITENGNFDTKFSGGFLKTGFTGDKMNIAGERWGIWQDVYKGDYRNKNELGSWLSYEGGRYNGDGYFIRTFEGVDDLNGGLVVDLMSTYMDHKTLGAYTGTILARYGEYSKHSDNLEGLGFGTWSESALAWSTDIDGRFGGYEKDIYYTFNWRKWRLEEHLYNALHKDGYITGIVGALASPFESLNIHVPIVLMGEADTKGLKTWWGRVDGKSYAGDGSVMPRGIIGGSISTSSDSTLNDIVRGALAFLYIDKDGNAGTLTGDFSGTRIEDINMWIATGGMKATERATGYDPKHYKDKVKENDIKGYLNGSFEGGGSITNDRNIADISEGYVGSSTYSLKRTSSGAAESWGIYGMELGGSFVMPATPTDNWTIAMGGNSWAINEHQGHSENRRHVNDYWLATVKGEQWSSGQLTGSTEGVWFAATGDGKVKAGTISGRMNGDYIDVDEGTGTWTAINTGEWVEVTDLLDANAMFGEDGLSALNNFVNVPLTEVCASIMTGPGSFAAGGSISATMAATLYATSPAALEGIWTALFSGAFSGATSNSWSATVVNGSDTATLNGSQWVDGNWVADVTGTVGGNSITGQAAGTYTDGGNFSGVGGGTFQPPEPPAEPPANPA